MLLLFAIVVGLAAPLTAGCSRAETVQIEATAYCGCRKCCAWTRGSLKYLKLNFWNRYVSEGRRKGRRYDGRTANTAKPRQSDPGLISLDSIHRPWMIPVRLVFFPWLVLPQKGTIAADTRYYPFGTRMYVPGYGWGIVQDRGGAIKGPNRIDLYYRSHRKALEWGRQEVTVRVYKP